MSTRTKKVFGLSALILATGIVSAASAGTVFPTDEASYARWRVDAAFNVVADLPQVPFSLPVAMKGDLAVPAGCASASGDTQAECMDVAYEPDTHPSVVVETRVGSTSTLERMDAMTVAGVTAPSREQSE